MNKDKVIEYVMNSPYNTNRAVLESLLNGGQSDGGDDSPLTEVIFEQDVEFPDKNQVTINLDTPIAEVDGSKGFVISITQENQYGYTVPLYTSILLSGGTVSSSLAGFSLQISGGFVSNDSSITPHLGIYGTKKDETTLESINKIEITNGPTSTTAEVAILCFDKRVAQDILSFLNR